MAILRQILGLLGRRERFMLFGLSLLQFAASALEVFGIAVILPFIRIVGEPSLLLDHEMAGPFLAGIGLEQPREVILAAGGALAFIFILKSAFIALSIRLFYGFLYDQQVSIAARLYDSYLRGPYVFHLGRNSSQLVRNVTQEVNSVVGTILHGISLPREMFVSVGLIAVLFITNSLATLAVVAILGLLGLLVATYTGKRLAKKGRVRVEQQARTMQSVNEGLGTLTEVKVLGREGHFVEDLRENMRKLTEALLGNVLYQQYPRLFIETIGGVAAIAIIIIPIMSGRNLAEILPVLALFGVAFVRLIPSFNRIIQSVNAVRFAAPSISVIHDEMRAFPVSGGASDRAEPALDAPLVLDRVTYRYPDSDVPALADVSLTIEPGRMVSFVGPSGAGKTTLAGVLLGLLEPTSGAVRVGDVELSDCLATYRRRIGYIPQDIYLLDTTIRRNVGFGLSEAEIDDEAVWRALESAQLGDFVRGLPRQLETLVGERGVLVSAGQRQRIGIARALYHDPPILVLDEATSALDNETERQFSDAIDRLSSKTLIVIAHRLTTIRHSDVIHVLEEGRLVGSGDFEMLRHTNSAFRRLLGDAPVIQLAAREAV
ncbi:MAG: ABC transporter ATP-binding protein [Rhodothermales bacterium]